MAAERAHDSCWGTAQGDLNPSERPKQHLQQHAKEHLWLGGPSTAEPEEPSFYSVHGTHSQLLHVSTTARPALTAAGAGP